MNSHVPKQSEDATHWHLFGENYAHYGSPMKPCEQDVAAYMRALTSWKHAYRRADIRALLCGVTPALAGMPWPDGTKLLAVDRSEHVIRALWPYPPGKKLPVCADWLQLPQADGACDVVAGDGSFVALDYPEGFRALTASLQRILNVGGLLVMRCFTRLEQREEPAEVFADLYANRIGGFHQFKWRLVIAMQTDVTRGVIVKDVFDTWAASGTSARRLSKRTGWDEDVINTITYYEGRQTRLTFPTQAELEAVLREFFDDISISFPDYPLGDRCPIVSCFRRPK
jgi:hypothetical protein